MEFCGITSDFREDKNPHTCTQKNQVRKTASKNVHGYPLSYYVTTMVYINTQNS